MTMSPTQLTIRHLRAEGWPLIEIVEHWNPFARIRQDLFGFVDVLAVRPDETLAVQTTTSNHAPDRARKIREHQNIAAVRAAGWQVRVHGWEKKRGRWVLQRDIDLTSKETPCPSSSPG